MDVLSLLDPLTKAEVFDWGSGRKMPSAVNVKLRVTVGLVIHIGNGFRTKHAA